MQTIDSFSTNMADESVKSCLICGKPCDSRAKDFVGKPTKKGLLTILTAAEKRQDGFAKHILPCKNSILSGNMNFKYHTSCRSSYISNINISLMMEKEESSTDDAQPSTSGVPYTRNNQQNFDIRKSCLFCKRTGKKKKEGITAIKTGK